MTDVELRKAISALSPVRSDSEPIVSLYLDTSWTDEKQRERARVFAKDAARRALEERSAHPERDRLERTLERVAEAASEEIGRQETGSRGFAVFACEALGLWHVLRAPQPFRNELSLDARPRLLQLARLADDAEPALVAFVHDRGLHIYELALGGIVDETTVERAVPNRHGQGGRLRGGASPSPRGASGGAYFERERKNQRHVEVLVERVRREGVERLTEMWERDPRQRLVLVGTSEKTAALERLLPERVRGAVLARLPRPPGKGAWSGGGKDEIVRKAVEELDAHERATTAAQVEGAIGEAMRGGLAVLGPEDVVLAVNERRVRRLLLEEDFERTGWTCRNCGALGTTHDEVCRFCQGPLARVEALGEELAGRVLAEDGEVEIVAHTQRLHTYHGVAAFLRQARAKGLSGRQEEAPRE